jgi:lipopolysaccharide biosynthesis glycosyltransferase
MDNKIHILLTSDNNYAQYLAVTIISVLENNSQAENLIFHIIENGINQENKEKILSLKNKYNTNISIYNLDNNNLEDLPSINHLSKAAYLRLLAPEILPTNIDKILYLDCDLVVLGDIDKLYQEDLDNNYIGAVKDLRSKCLALNFSQYNIKDFFNSGVMLIDLKKWRENNISQKLLIFAREYKNQLITADQDILNCLLKDKWQNLPRKYNYDSKDLVFNKIPKDTLILHYSGETKPWSYLYNKADKKYFFHYLSLSPFSNFNYIDKSLKNYLKKKKDMILSIIKNILRPFIPNIILEIRRIKYNQNIKRNF